GNLGRCRRMPRARYGRAKAESLTQHFRNRLLILLSHTAGDWGIRSFPEGDRLLVHGCGWGLMDELEDGGTTAFEGYVEALVGVIGHADRAEPLRDYCLGLRMPMARKSVEPLAAVTAPERVLAKHQSLLHFVGQSPWSDEALLARVRDRVHPTRQSLNTM